MSIGGAGLPGGIGGASPIGQKEPVQERPRERVKETQPVTSPGTDAVVVRDGPDNVHIVIQAPEMAKKRETYPERVARLQGQIDLQAEQVMKLADADGLDPTDYKMMYSFDISGDAGEVCAFCGREGCQYKPTAYRKENKEIDLLKDAMTVAQEVATKLGLSYGLIAYDEDLIPLREVLPPDDLADRASVIEMFGSFKDRHDNPDITDRGWLDEMLAKWDISMKTANVAGEPNDKGMMELTSKMLAAADASGPAALMLAKSSKPKSSLRPLEAAARQEGITPSSLSVGKDAEENARNMFSKTLNVVENHGLVESIGAGTAQSLDLQ